MIRILKNARVAVLFLSFFLGAQAALAQGQQATYLSKNASECEIFRALSRLIPSQCATASDRQIYLLARPGEGTRSLTRVGKASNSVTAAEQTNAPKRLSAAFKVEFKFDSHELTPAARKVLDRVAAVIKNRLMEKTFFRIEGHADAAGSDQYNMSLSQNRALAVRSYLVGRHGIDGNRLMSIGKGESAPYDPANPYGAANRRVEFANLNG